MIRHFAQSLLAAIHDSVAASAGMRTLRFANTLAVDRSFGQTRTLELLILQVRDVLSFEMVG
jgi:hypothetical protein